MNILGRLSRNDDGLQWEPMNANHKELVEKWKSESPEKRRKGFANLARAMNFPDLVPIEEMTEEEVEASLRRQGFTDEDFKRLNEKIQDVLSKYRPSPPIQEQE